MRGQSERDDLMRTILRYFKPHIPAVLLIIALLYIRAQGELALPDYMSDIVDNGISQNGVSSVVPEASREESLLAMAALFGEGERDTFASAYRRVDSSSPDFQELSEKYPYLKEHPIYVLEASDDEVEALEAAMLQAGIKAAGISAQAPEDIPESMITARAKELVKAEYAALGMDMNQKRLDYILGSGGKMLLVLLMILGVILLETFLASRMAAGIAKALRRDVFAKVTSFGSAEFSKFSTASLITRSTNDIQQIQIIAFLFLRFVVFSPMLGVGAVIKVINSGSDMTWIIAVSAFTTLVFVFGVFALVTPKFKVMQKFVDRLNLVTREALTGVMVVRAFNKERTEEEKFGKASGDLRDLGLFVMRVFACMNPLINIVANGTTLMIIWVGARLIDAGDIQLGTMMAFLQYALQVINSFLMLTMITINLPRALVSINRISEVLRKDSSVADPPADKVQPLPQNPSGVVEFRNVTFKYPDAEEYLLRDISFTAKPGQTTAFIGSTGSGKSTVVNLIPRFYDVTDGQILVDGADVRTLRTKELRGRIGYIPQKALLFSGSIATNIKFGEAAGTVITDGDMETAAEIAQAKDFIEEKPDKYDEPISQAGANVSGGQKQRLSIARAIAKFGEKPGIFIFDDSFSALDYKTDAALRRAIAEKLGGSTVIVVAQRIGTIKNADQIIVLDNGRVVGMGRHRELLAGCEVYRQIALSQLSEKELAL
jgi:ATP-binding cassette subfamily B protein